MKKAGKADEKQALLLAIGTLLEALPQDASGAAGEGLARLADPKGSIAKLAGEDANEDTRSLGYAALAALARALPEATQGPLVQEILKPLSDKKASDRVRLAALEVRVGQRVCSWRSVACSHTHFPFAQPPEAR